MEFVLEPVSSQQRTAWRVKLQRLSLHQLRALEGELQAVMTDAAKDTELTIAVTHCDQALVCDVLRAEKRGRRTFKTQTIYCCANRCADCPHGEYMYVYNEFHNGTTTVKYIGRPALPVDVLKRMQTESKPL